MWKRSHISGDKAFHLSETTFRFLKKGKKVKQPSLFYHLVPVPDLREEAQHHSDPRQIQHLSQGTQAPSFSHCHTSLCYLMWASSPYSNMNTAILIQTPQLLGFIHFKTPLVTFNKIMFNMTKSSLKSHHFLMCQQQHTWTTPHSTKLQHIPFTESIHSKFPFRK